MRMFSCVIPLTFAILVAACGESGGAGDKGGCDPELQG
jgi:hypothetical protein